MIVIIGGSGFVGTSLCNRLETLGSEFCIFDKSTSSAFPNKVLLGDVCNLSQLDKVRPIRAIVNLAAEHRDDVKPRCLYDRVNVEGAKAVCSFARANNVNTIVFTSSVAVYGFAPKNTDESGEINYFNDYGRTKYLAEIEYSRWQKEDPENRVLVIVRPTAIFGKGNRGNVYNLMAQISRKRFLMIGNGRNIKSIAYIENVTTFLLYCLDMKPGIHTYNYVDKPDMDMNSLVSIIRKEIHGEEGVGIRIPAALGIVAGYLADVLAMITGRTLPISSIRVKKFVQDTQFDSSVNKKFDLELVSLKDALRDTIRYEFPERAR